MKANYFVWKTRRDSKTAYVSLEKHHSSFSVMISLGLRYLVAQMVRNLPAMQEIQVDPWVGKIAWRKEWLPTPVFLPGVFHGQRSLAGYSTWGSKESDSTEWLTYVMSWNISSPGEINRFWIYSNTFFFFIWSFHRKFSTFFLLTCFQRDNNLSQVNGS